MWDLHPSSSRAVALQEQNNSKSHHVTSEVPVGAGHRQVGQVPLGILFSLLSDDMRREAKAWTRDALVTAQRGVQQYRSQTLCSSFKERKIKKKVFKASQCQLSCRYRWLRVFWSWTVLYKISIIFSHNSHVKFTRCDPLTTVILTEAPLWLQIWNINKYVSASYKYQGHADILGVGGQANRKRATTDTYLKSLFVVKFWRIAIALA